MAKNVSIGETYRGALPFVLSDIIRVGFPRRLPRLHDVFGAMAVWIAKHSLAQIYIPPRNKLEYGQYPRRKGGKK